MEKIISFSSRSLAPAHTAKTTSKWFADHDITDLNPIWNLWDIFKTKMRNIKIIKTKTKKLLKCFTSHVINLEYMKVSLFEKNKINHDITIFGDTPVYYVNKNVYFDVINRD